MTGNEQKFYHNIESIAKSLHSISKSMDKLVQHVNNPLTEEQLRSEGYDNISDSTDR